MSCTIEDELTAYVDGELSAVEAARVRSHLTSCSDCRSTESLLRRTVTQLAALPSFEPSSALRRRVLAQVEGLPRPWPERMRSWLRPSELAVAENYELLSDYEVVGLDPADLDVVEHLDQLEKEGRP